MLGLFSLEKRRLRGDLPFSKGGYGKGGEGVCARECSARMRGDGFKLEEVRFSFATTKKFLAVRMARRWTPLPRGAVDAPSLELFKTRSDGAWSSLV